ncbi:hypothetical protein [Mangrovibacter plantisponsor]|uniref:Uncharacterized protein n=1 Tax=Mangrovibacter plantisponsor TaxID=451513 RepID=A0A317Q9R1_9ENTR|nr:hypothetical protein [Mangrovibacter plantisponsor]PWW12525.1 hypothetical protein DES37_10188 [Mangrovibacter plantisponsor]
MKKTVMAFSALLLATPVFAATTHATDETVAVAHEGADTAKEKLHQAQDKGDELKLKSEHAAEGKSGTLSSKVSEGSQKAWNKTKEGTEKGWDATKEGVEKGWDKTKATTEKGWDATKDGAEKGWDATKDGAEKLKNKVSE